MAASFIDIMPLVWLNNKSSSKETPPASRAQNKPTLHISAEEAHQRNHFTRFPERSDNSPQR